MITNKQGFTLLEVMVASILIVIVTVGLIGVFVSCSLLTEATGNQSRLLAEAQIKLEEMRNHSFSTLATDYASGGTPGNTFTLSAPNARGVIYMDTTNPDLIVVALMISWANRNGLVVGEDKDLDGVLDAGEDVNSNGFLDSPVTFSTIIGRKGA